MGYFWFYRARVQKWIDPQAMKRVAGEYRARKHHRLPADPLADRLITGAVLGMVAGFSILQVLGGEFTGRSRPWALGGDLLRLFAGAVAGGMLAAALIGPTERIRDSASGSAVVGAMQGVIAAGMPLLTIWSAIDVTPAGVAVYLGRERLDRAPE